MSRRQRAGSEDVGTAYIQRLNWRQAKSCAAATTDKVPRSVRGDSARPKHSKHPHHAPGIRARHRFCLSHPPRVASNLFHVSGEYQPAAAGRTYAGIIAFTSSGWLCRDGNGTAACQPCGQAKLRPCADCNDGAGRERLLVQSMI